MRPGAPAQRNHLGHLRSVRCPDWEFNEFNWPSDSESEHGGSWRASLGSLAVTPPGTRHFPTAPPTPPAHYVVPTYPPGGAAPPPPAISPAGRMEPVTEEPQGPLLPASLEAAVTPAPATSPEQIPHQEDVSTNWGGARGTERIHCRSLGACPLGRLRPGNSLRRRDGYGLSSRPLDWCRIGGIAVRLVRNSDGGSGGHSTFFSARAVKPHARGRLRCYGRR